MIRGFFRDTAIYSVSSFIARGIGFFLLPLYTRLLTPADYGILDLLQVFLSFSLVVFSGELNQGVARFLPEMKTEQEKALCASTTLGSVLFSFFQFSIVGLIFSPALSSLLTGSGNQRNTILLTLPWIVSNAILDACQSQLRNDQKAKEYSIASLVVVGISIAATILFVMSFGMRVRGVILGQAAGCLSGAIVSFAFARSRYRFAFSLRLLRKMLSFSLPLIPSTLSVLVWNYVDRFLIRHYLSLAEVGIYGIGMRFASISALMLAGMNIALTPIIYANYQKEETRENLSQLFSILILGVSLLIVGVTIFAKEILFVMTSESFYSAASVIPMLMAGVVLSRLYNFAPGIFIAKKTYLVVVVNVAASALSLGSNLLLIPRIGLMGASLTNVITGIVIFLLYVSFGQRDYHIPYRIKDIATAGLSVVLVYLLSRFALDRMAAMTWFSIVSKAILFSVFALVIGLPILRYSREWARRGRG